MLKYPFDYLITKLANCSITLQLIASKADDNAAAAIYVHGFFESCRVAETYCRDLLQDEDCGAEFVACVVDRMDSWLPLAFNDTDPSESADCTEDVSVKENDTPAENKAGSVCDLPGKPHKGNRSTERNILKPTLVESRKDYDENISHMKSLLEDDLNDMSYGRLRDVHATCCAYKRKISTLIRGCNKSVQHLR